MSIVHEVEARCKMVLMEVEELRRDKLRLEEGEKHYLKQYEKQYDLWKENSDKLVAQMSESHKEEMNRQLDIEKVNRESQIGDLQACHALQIGHFAKEIASLKEEVGKSKSRSCTSQGQFGEVEVASLFQSAMSGSIVEWEDTTSIEGSCDGKARICRNDEEYVVLVEAKNVKVLHSKKDVGKFHNEAKA